MAMFLTAGESSERSCIITSGFHSPKPKIRSAAALRTALSSFSSASEIDFSSRLILAFQDANLIFGSLSVVSRIRIC